MKNFLFFNELRSLVLFIILKFSFEEMQYFPETYIKDDLIIPDNDIENLYQYNLVEAKVLTKQLITLYLKKQGIALDRDECCEGYETFDAWNTIPMKDNSEFEEIYSNAVFKEGINTLTYNFPVPRIESESYTLYHKVWVFNKGGSSKDCKIYFNNGVDNSAKMNVNLSGGKYFVNLIITFNETGLEENIIRLSEGGSIELTLNSNFLISTINFEFEGENYTPSIALHWTYYKISKENKNFSLKGRGICSYSNPCIKGYTCVGGLCERCHASCFDCKNGGLTTDCDTKCSTHSTRIIPDRGSCPLGYVDLSQFDSFTLHDLVPPTRNNRFTQSFWFFLSSFPQNSNIKPVYLANSYSSEVNFTFIFSNNDVILYCGSLDSGSLTALNTWYFVKCGIGFGRYTLYLKFFNNGNFEYRYDGSESESSDSGTESEHRHYNEPEDYITFYFESYNELYNNDIPFHFYIKQFVIFREYVQEPYDNKYFNYEKIFTSTFELPEVMFIIPFDELIKNDNKYDIKCYSYQGSILESIITLTPYYYQKNYTLFPPKLFRRLNLLDRNQKYTSPDLVKIDNVLRDNNTLIASYDYCPITCIDNYFLTYNSKFFNTTDGYEGICTYDCEYGYSSFPGLSEKKGFCNKKCSYNDYSSICLSNNYDLLHLRSKYKCKSGYFEIFDNCDLSDINREKNNVFLFNHDQGPANIVMDVINYNLKSYIIEFWIYLSYCTYVEGAEYTIFLTNQFQMTYRETDGENKIITNANRKITTNRKIERKKWNHVAIEVYYDPKEAYDRKSVIYLQYKLDSEHPTEIDHSENVLPLEYIYFCNGRKASCNNKQVGWHCDYYKNLRLFNGLLSNRYVINRYDEYYSEYKYLLSSIMFYYPLYGHYIANNLLSQYNSKDSALNTNSPTNNWNFPQYSYDRVKIEKKENCPNNCEECFFKDSDEKFRCYQCENNYHLYRDNKNISNNKISCKLDLGSDYVLKLPSNTTFKLTPLKGLNYAGVTVNFFIKIYGFEIRDKIDVIYLGEHLKINYNADIDSPYFGLNLVTFKGSSETVISNYYYFRKHFGVWTFISVSSYDQTYENFFPPMIRFEINDMKMPIIGPLENIAIGTIYFSNELFALVQRVKVYNTYLIGSIALETHNRTSTPSEINKEYYTMSQNNGYDSYFFPMENEADCLFSKFNLIGTDKVNEEIIVPNYECVPDDIKEIYSNDNFLSLSSSNHYYFESEIKAINTTCNKECDFCFNRTKYDCSCNFINNEKKIFLGNVSNHFCENLKLVNFAKKIYKEGGDVPEVFCGGKKFTLHFWVFAYSYVDKVFQGFTVEWRYHTTIRVGIDPSNNYYFTCLINDAETNKFMEFKMNEWNFLHCAVDYEDRKFHISSENIANEVGFTYEKIPDEVDEKKTTSLRIKDLTDVKDWGYLFFRSIRLWKNVIKFASFLSRINIKESYFNFTHSNGTLLHQWDSIFNKEHKIKSSYETNYTFTIEYSSDKIGTNIVPEEVYQKVKDEPDLCQDKGQFFDRKTKTCINFTDISNIKEDIQIGNIDVAYSHNYGIAFWILFQNHTDILRPINIIWQYHMQISLNYVGSTFKAYCFPQNYKPYSDILENQALSLDEKAQKILNSATNEYTYDLSGNWAWFQCSLSYNNRYFYLNENEQQLIIETLYKEGNTEFKNDEPLGYFFNGITKDLSMSTLRVEITGNRDRPNDYEHCKIYLRCLYLFRDFLPYNYNFKYMDMFKIESDQFPPLAFAMNFAEFDFDKRDFFQVKYSTFKSINNKKNETNHTIYFKKPDQLELAENFVFLPLCNPLTKEKYNSETQLCQEIADCDYTALNALYCMEEKTPLVCKKNYYINIDSITNTAFCSNYCEDPDYFRSPGTTEYAGICGTKCLSINVLKTCPNSASSILNYQDKFECNPSYNRIGYQCIQEPTKNLPNEGALFYSGINYPYNIYHSFSNGLLKVLDMNYVLEFWFMIDNVIYKKKDFLFNTEYYYFFSSPHLVYLKKEKRNADDNVGILKYYYKYNNKNTPYDITHLINQYEWNKILIFVDSEEKLITLYVNFDKANKIPINVANSDITNKKLNLQYIYFCSAEGGGDIEYIKSPKCKSDIKWASAYYNNIRVWNLKISTIDTIQSFVNKIYLEYPHSLVLFYPLKIKYLDNNEMQNILTEYYNENFKLDCTEKTCTIYKKDNIIIYNYSTKFDWGLLHSKQFVSSISDDDSIDPNDENNNCNEHCIRCYDTDNIKECYECETGYVLQYKECKDARKLYFLKTPSGTVGASVNFKTKNKEGEDYCDLTSFTIVFWMKFFGIKYATQTDYCKILSIDSNTYLSYQNSTNNLVFRENSKNVFIDYKFRKYFGIWIPIAIANYISNSISDVYPNMLTLSVNRIDIPFVENYNLPSSGLKATELSFGSEIIALFAELSIYSKFIQGAYGRIRSQQVLTDQFYYKSLTGTKSDDCLVVDDDLQSKIDLICAPDYSVNFIDSYYCKDDTKYYEPYDENNDEKDTKCGSCHSECITLCYADSEQNCTCDMTEGIFWLRKVGKKNNLNQTYCEHIYYLDFSNINAYTYYNTPVTKTQEYTIEFWLFIYPYNTKAINFKELYLEWNFHNRIRLYEENTALKVDCQPIWRSIDFTTTTYSDVRTSSFQFPKWNYIRCGTDLKNRKYFSNSNIEYPLKAKKENFFDYKEIETYSSGLKFFKIYRSEDFKNNFGIVFIREIKLWQQYNLDYLDSQRLFFDMGKIAKEQIKINFPGLLMYYKNLYNQTKEGNSVIKEELTATTTIVSKSPDYLGYNIVDPNPDAEQYMMRLEEEICPYGHVYDTTSYECICADGFNEIDGDCIPIGNELDATCEIYSNIYKQCFQCKENNKYLNKWVDEFGEECYSECPPTLYEDPLINQCRRCHETCYECTNEYYNNCTSCTGVLYFNFKENTCIPNCQAAGLTRSLTKPNICVYFDCDAVLVNVEEEIPINIHTFDEIEAEIIQPTSSEYETLWLFDANKTNIINRELGFEDDLDLNANPFIGDKTKLNTPLDHTFFITEHKYVFGLKVFAENKGLEVDLYFWWTLTMNAPPFGGKLTVMPYLGLFNTTTFIMRCVDYKDENTPSEDLEYEFYYVEVNTNYKIKLTQDFSLNNEVYSNFTVRYYQLEYSNITIYCQVRDKWGAISEASNMITIVNQKNSPLYILKQLVASFYIVNDALTDIQLLARAEVLMSLGINPYTERVPSSYFTTYEASLTGEKVLILEPQCVNGYCNDNGDCEIIDVALTCKCTALYLGKQCFLDKNGYSDLSDYYVKMYLRLKERISDTDNPFNDIVFQAFYKLFFAAQNFFQNDTFFTNNLVEFKNYLKTEYNYITENLDRFNKILDLDDFFFNYFYVKETQIKLTTKINEGYPFRNKTLTDDDAPSYANGIYVFFQMLNEDTIFIIKNYGYDYSYKCQHFVYELIKIDETFNDTQFFESLKTPLVSYKPTILFMNCLKQKYPTFNFFLNYIEFLVNPMSYDSTFYPNITSPLISIKIYDLFGNELIINNCASPIKINMPFNSYDWIDYINIQKWLFLPENYKLEDDPIFRDPILIWDNGSISDDTVEQRIAKYYRYYNIVGLVYTPDSPSLFEYTSFLFKNISDTFFLLFETNHLSLFSSMIIPNIMNFVVDGRFFYIPRYMVLMYFPNQINNPVFYIIFAFLILYVFISLNFLNKDQIYFDNLEDLQILKREIIKAKNDYNQFDLGLNDENIIRNLPQKDARLKKNESKKIRTMFDDYDVDGIQEIDEDEKEEEKNENENNLKNIMMRTGSNNLRTLNTNEGYSNTGRRMISRYETKTIEEENVEEEIEKATGIYTHKRKKNKENHKNPPRRKNYNENEDNDDEAQEYSLQKKISKKKSNFDFDKAKTDRYKKKKNEEKKSDNGYGNGDEDEDFDENRIEKMSSKKSTIKYGFRGTKQNFDLQTINSLNNKLGYDITKYSSKFSRLSKLSSQSKKSYYLDKEKTKANLVSLDKFHDHSKIANIDKNLPSKEEENKKNLEEYTRLNLTPFEFFKFNLLTRHILIAPFLNLTLYHNRWKKLMVLLTQFYIQQLALSIILTSNESIIASNFTGMLLASLIAGIISNIIIYCFVFLFEANFYERIKLFRLVMNGEDLYIFKVWSTLQKKMNIKLIFGIIICVVFWIPNLYISLIFTAVWKVQRNAWILCVFITLFLDLVVGEICVEGICAFFYSYRLTFNCIRNFGNFLNNLRRYRTMYP